MKFSQIRHICAPIRNSLFGVKGNPDQKETALDNALEACLALPENRAIQVTLLREGSLYLSIRNTSKEVKILEGSIATTKKPAAAHGFGLP